jgi:hypothetical protein
VLDQESLSSRLNVNAFERSDSDGGGGGDGGGQTKIAFFFEYGIVAGPGCLLVQVVIPSYNAS